MNYYRIIMSLLLIIGLGTPATASDIQQGIHGMKWGSAIAEYDNLTKVHEVKQTAYYANSNMVYQTAKVLEALKSEPG